MSAFRNPNTIPSTTRDIDRCIEELQKQLRVVEQRAARAEEEKARAEEEKARAKEETRETTLPEYIEACYNLVFANFTVETNKKITSKGSITSLASRRCLPRLEP
jgi:hypothetical protein